ncbi:MAG: PEGA domain-containing protein [Planctomycetota bacterium]
MTQNVDIEAGDFGCSQQRSFYNKDRGYSQFIKGYTMGSKDRGILALAAILILAGVLSGGCVQRKLTINTVPDNALISLNDEEIGYSPVTVGFNWYGDYSVRVTKPGYQTLNTHRKLKEPWYDNFPADFFAQVLWPGTKIDSREWTFELQQEIAPQRDELIDAARKFQKDALLELGREEKTKD